VPQACPKRSRFWAPAAVSDVVAAAPLWAACVGPAPDLSECQRLARVGGWIYGGGHVELD